jgi:hypothetical protein
MKITNQHFGIEYQVSELLLAPDGIGGSLLAHDMKSNSTTDPTDFLLVPDMKNIFVEKTVHHAKGSVCSFRWRVEGAAAY